MANATAPLERIEALIAVWDGKRVYVEIPLGNNGALVTVAGKLMVKTYADTDNPCFEVWGMGHGVTFPGIDVQQIVDSTCANSDGTGKHDTLSIRLKKS
jgi:hypothetical protein